MTRKYICVMICLMLVLSMTGCSFLSKEDETTEAIESTENNTAPIEVETVLSKNHVEIDVDAGPEGTFYTVPMYFQQEFKNVEFGHLNVSENGNLITCLSMLDSFYASSYITPDLFIEKYKDCFFSDGTYDTQTLIENVAVRNDRVLTKVPLDPYTLEQYVRDYHLAVLVHINHASIYGENSSYVIITEITDDGQLLVRDPNKANVEKYAVTLENGETIYRSFEFFFSAGKDACVYVLGGGQYEIEEAPEYEGFDTLD